jgi:adenine deaminase
MRAAHLAATHVAELHPHIEGALELEMALRFAPRNGVLLPYQDVEALSGAYRFGYIGDSLAASFGVEAP